MKREIGIIMLSVFAVSAEPQNISTIAGSTWVFPVTPLPAVQAPLGWVSAVTIDLAQNYYVVDLSNNLVLKVNAAGTLITVAGNGSNGYSGDGGPATSAALNNPSGIAVDSAGHLFIADSSNSRIRRVDTAGIITTVAGDGTAGYSGDNGSAISAELGSPVAVTVDAVGNLYIADSYNNRIRKVNTSGIITTLAGDGTAGYSGDGGPAINAELNSPVAVAVTVAGNLFIADSYNNRVRMVNQAGAISTVAGNGSCEFGGDGGLATAASLCNPQSVAVDSAGDLFIADYSNLRIREVNALGIITTVAGNGVYAYSGDGGPATSASLAYPDGVAVDGFGNLLIADEYNGRVRKIASGNIISTVAGDGLYNYGGDGGPATSAQLNEPHGVAADTAGNLFIADAGNNRIRMVTAGGMITTVAGNGIYAYSGDGGPATNASLDYPSAVAVDSTGNLFIADSGNSVVRKVAPGGTITTLAGNGTSGYSGDGGAATSASLWYPEGIALDGAGNLFIADTFNNRIRMVSPGGMIATVAGNGTYGYSGDGGPASNAALNYPSSVTVDGTGNLFIADYGNNLVRQVAPGGTITTIAGDGISGYSGDGGLATSAELAYPEEVLVDGHGNLFVADSGNQRIRMISPGGVITTVVGNGMAGYSGDGGPATTASLYFPGGIALDRAGDLLIADTSNNRIRAVLTNDVASTYMVGDVAPFTGDMSPAFGDGSLDILDLVQVLFAVNSVPGFRPAACSDRFDAMDVYPVDTPSNRGGDGVLDIRDLTRELFRVNNLDLDRPVRAPRGEVCPGAANPNSASLTDASLTDASPTDASPTDASPTDASRNAGLLLMTRANVHGTLALGDPEKPGEAEERVPVYLEAGRDLVRVAVTFALGDQRSQLRFVATADTPPSLVQDSQLGVVAVAWLEGVSVRTGERLLLGYVVGPTGVSANLKVYGASAVGSDDNREVRLAAPTTVGGER